jgi:uncharacterized protein (DUF1330 family)
MAVYGVAQITIADRTAYDRYSAAFMEVFSRFKGTLLAVDENPGVIEGEWTATRLVLISFPDEAAFHAWFDSPDYQEIARHRHAGSTAVILLARGLGGQADAAGT